MNRGLTAERHLAIKGTHNLRDIGGYEVAGGGRIRWRLLLRGDAPDAVTPARWRALKDMQVRTFVDLRDPGESTEPIQPTRGAGHVAVPILGDDLIHGVRSLEELYDTIIDRRAHRIADAISALAEPRALPAVVHCSAGKDRTGLVIGLLLSALGVADDDVGADYALTGRYLTDEFRRALALRAERMGFDQQALAAMLGAPPELMVRTLERVRAQHGDAEQYLLGHGVPKERWAALRRTLIDRSA